MSVRIVFAAATAFALVAAPGALPAQTGPVTIGISGGPSFPTGEFAGEAKTGYHVQGSLGFSMPLLPVGLRADLLWQDFQDETSGTFTEIGGLLNGVFALPLPIARPYLIGGAGLFHHDTPEAVHGGHTHAAESGTSFGFAAGAGVEFPFLGLTGALEARYVDAGEDHRSIPVSVGVRF